MSIGRHPRGFSLMELMITLAILGILVAIALPSYRGHVRKSQRAEAQSYMMSVAARQQQYLVDTRGYISLATMNGVIATPANVSSAYTIGMTTAANPPAFTLTLTPTGDQQNEACGTLTINQTGTKTATKSGSAVNGCW